MRSPSVTTMSLAGCGQLRSTSAMRPRSLAPMNRPRGRWKMWPNSLAREPHGRRVDERLHLVDVVAHHAEEQRLVAVVQRVERDVLLEVVGQAAQVAQHPLRLLLQREHVRRQQAAQAERVALLLGERRALVEQRVAQQREATWSSRRQNGYPAQPCSWGPPIGDADQSQRNACHGLAVWGSATTCEDVRRGRRRRTRM